MLPPAVTTALRAASAALLVVVVSAVVVRLAAASFDPFRPYPGHTSDYGVARARAIRAALPDIAGRPQKTVLALGSSGLARAFVPSVFDAALDRGKTRHLSFNLAQLLQQPETALAMAHVIRREYEARNKRIHITLFGISVPELTRGALGAARWRIPDQALVFTTHAALAERAGTDPLGAFGDGLQLLVYGDVRPERVGAWLLDRAMGRPPPCESGMKQPPDGVEALAALTSFCDELHAEFPGGVPPWNPSTRGGFDFGLPATRPMLARLIELQKAADEPASAREGPARQKGNATVTVDVDRDAVRMLAEAARELAAVSDHTFVLRDIMNPATLETLSPGLISAWRVVAEGIARQCDAPLLDFNDGTFVPADFGDRTHLNPLAAERFSTLLAARVQPVVEQDRASR